MKTERIPSTIKEDKYTIDSIRNILRDLAEKPIITHLEMSRWTFNTRILPMLSPNDRLFAVEMESILGLKVKLTDRFPSYSNTMEIHYSDGSMTEYMITTPFQLKKLGGQKWQE